MTKVWNAIPAQWKALGALFAAFLAGLAVANWLGAQALLPSQVAALTDTTRVHSRRLDAMETRVEHEADINAILEKLDCALFDLPRGCRETMSPR